MDLNTTIDDIKQRSPEWFAARRGRITASMVGAILGVSPTMTPEDAMRSIVRDWHGAEREFQGNVATEYGVHHEAGALVDYMMQVGNDVLAFGFVTRDDWAGCSPDGLIGSTGGLEIKCPYSKRKEPGDGFKPIADQPHYYAQVQFSLWVCKREWWHFWQWAPWGFTLDTIEPDAAWQARNLPKLREFYERFLIEREFPHAQAHLDSKRVIVDTPEARQRLAEYDDLIEAIELAEARKKELLASLVEMAGARDAEICGRKLSKVSRAGSIAYAKAVKDHLPDLDLEAYRGKPSEYWMLK